MGSSLSGRGTNNAIHTRVSASPATILRTSIAWPSQEGRTGCYALPHQVCSERRRESSSALEQQKRLAQDSSPRQRHGSPSLLCRHR